MDKNALWKWLILFVLVVGSLSSVLPIKDKVRLGLDLQGGTSFTVQIEREALREKLLSETPAEWEEMTEQQRDQEIDRRMKRYQDISVEVLRNRVDNLGIAEPVIYPEKNGRIVVQLPGVDDETRQEARRAIEQAAFLTFRLVHKDNMKLVEELFKKGLAPPGYRIVPSGQRQYYERDEEAVPPEEMDRTFRRRLLKWQAPATYDFMLEEETVGNRTLYRPYFVDRRRQLTGESLKGAGVDYRAMGQPVVDLEFDGEGSKRFSTVTSDYARNGQRNMDSQVGRLLAIVLDGKLYSAPELIEPIHTGRAQISGNFSFEEASFLANILRAGSLPAPVEIIETRVVGPGLGHDSIESGARAVIWGGVLVVVFMAGYYLLSGIVADIALLLNMVLLPLGMILAAGFLGIFSKDVTSSGGISLPVLTLPGIAGILLTVGMAVDANVLIFERVREEFRSGKRFWPAITAGYDRAFVTILDANLTTLLTGVILFIFGSGPIRGFAVTLCAGIIVSMYTALIVTRMIFHLFAKSSLKSLHMFTIIKDASLNLLGQRKIAGAISVFLIVATWAVLISRGTQDATRVFGVDFTGGSSMQLTFDEGHKPDIDAIRRALTGAGLNHVLIQYQSEMEVGGTEYLVIKAPPGDVNGEKVTEVVERILHDTPFDEAGFAVASVDSVGPQVGKELKGRAVKALIIALLGIVIYITIRFEFGFALGAIVALAHDVLITMGIFSLLGNQLTLPVIAALLTIVGYSVNDTIVVFDRIREDLKLVRGKSFEDLCNQSINETLSRTLLTSMTTLVAVGSLLVVGGGAINDFALTLCIGVLVGTYSSVFVATPVVLLYHKGEKPAMVAAKTS